MVENDRQQPQGELTDEPAQNGQEFRMRRELLRDRAPKDSATMDPPSSSCNKPRESSGRPGSSSRDPPPVIREEADKPRGRFRWGGSLCGAAPVTGQQDPGSTTGSDMSTDWKENPRTCGISARKGLSSRSAGCVPLPSWWAVLNNTLTGRHRCWAHFHIVWQPVQSVRAGGGAEAASHCGAWEQKSNKCALITSICYLFIYLFIFGGVLSIQKVVLPAGKPKIPNPWQPQALSGLFDFLTFFWGLMTSRVYLHQPTCWLVYWDLPSLPVWISRITIGLVTAPLIDSVASAN